MERLVRERTEVLTALLTIVSLALVFGAVLRVGPATALPAAPDAVLAAIPHANAAISATAIGTIVVGVRAVKRGDVRRHKRLMATTFALFVGFLALYLYRVSLLGPTGFPESAPAWVETYVYFPVLAVHILLAIVCIPLVYYALLLAYSYPVAELPDTPHPRVGRAAAGLWLISFALGIVVYVLLYWLF